MVGQTKNCAECTYAGACPERQYVLGQCLSHGVDASSLIVGCTNPIPAPQTLSAPLPPQLATDVDKVMALYNQDPKAARTGAKYLLHVGLDMVRRTEPSEYVSTLRMFRCAGEGLGGYTEAEHKKMFAFAKLLSTLPDTAIASFMAAAGISDPISYLAFKKQMEESAGEEVYPQ